MRMRREVQSGQWDPKTHGTGKVAETFTPVSGPKSFKVNVADGIQGANQQRQETWDKGAMTGSYSQPLGNGKWQVVNYVADDKGFRVLSTKIVDEADLLEGQAAGTQKANVNIDQNGEKTAYSVTADQLAKNKKSKDNQIKKDSKNKDNKNDKDTKEEEKSEHDAL